jgi:hypothetical protein
VRQERVFEFLCGLCREERDMTKWAEQRIKDLLVGYTFPSFERGSIKINEVKKVEGHVSCSLFCCGRF